MLKTLKLTILAGLLLSFSALAGPPLYSIQTSVTGQGTITLDPQKSGYQKNNIVAVEAVAEPGWSFVNWGGDLSGTQNPTTLRVSGEHSITALFTSDSSSGGGGGAGSGGGGTVVGVYHPDPLPQRGMIVGYFAQWTIYRRGYLPRHVQASGAAGRLDVVNYAFAAPDANLRCASLDTFADFGKRYDASESVDGIADTVSQPLKGNFNQLLKLKQLHPNLRVMISLGGWTESYRFTEVAKPENRQAFVKSCIDMFIRGDVAPGISAAGLFDGIDVDWEYPGSCGNTCDWSEADAVNFSELLAEFRSQLNGVAAEVVAAGGNEPEYLLTIAAPAGAANYVPLEDELGEIQSPLDWINVMTYDFHGGWESSGPTNHHAALYPSACEDPDGDWADKAIQAYQRNGVPASKLTLGVPFYGRGWRAAAVNDGLCQPASGVPRGTYEKGVDDYEVLDAKAKPDYRDEGTGTHWTFDGSQFWSYDDTVSVSWKADYANCEGLRGVMFWELSGDDLDGSLLNALDERLGNVEFTCSATGSTPP
jgi:chitinase